MRKVAIITDDTCDLPADLIDELEIIQVPTKVIFSDKTFKSTGVKGELTLDEYYKRAEQELPTTSTASLGEISRALDMGLEKADAVIAIFVSNHMSPYANNTKTVIKQYFSDKNILVVDSKVTSVGLGILVLEAARLAPKGGSFIDISNQVSIWLDQVHFAGIMHTLENLVRTGRVPKTKKFMADFFKVKPIVKLVDGQVSVMGKIRANEDLIIKQMKKFGRLAIEHMNGESDYVLIGHTRWLDAAQQVADFIAEHNPNKKNIIIQETGAIV
ncbi:MAG: DegV family protein, partial [Asgard group archaeon]|nr:DegV family protein [Asgard group archaeon]